MLTYLAICGDVTCNKFDTSTAKWFNIYQVGRKSEGPAVWVQVDLMTGAPTTVSLLSNLVSDNYPSDTKSSLPTFPPPFKAPSSTPLALSSRLLAPVQAPPSRVNSGVPGGFNDNDKSIFDSNVFDVRATYVFPEPQIAFFVSVSSSDLHWLFPIVINIPLRLTTKSASSPSSTSTSSKSEATKSRGWWLWYRRS